MGKDVSCSRDLPMYHPQRDKEDICKALTYRPRILNYIVYKSQLPVSETYTQA